MKKYIERISFILGMITAFGECVAGEAKRLALSPPFFYSDLEALKEQGEKIAKEQNIYLYLELNEEMPQTKRVLWWVIYKYKEDLDWYLKLRKQQKNPAWDFESFKELLGYGFVWGENAKLVIPKMRRQQNTMDTVKRVLFSEGGWPVDKP